MVETWKIFEYWLPKIAALFSMGGSSIIVAEIYQDWKGKRNSRSGISTISQALLSMSLGDIIFSFAWFIASWVVSQSEDVLVSYEATQTGWGCKLQGFLIQFGFYASLCSNASLAIIYLLLMRYQWPSERLSYYFKRAACIIWLFSLALGIIPLFLDLYHDTGGFCWLSPPPSDAPECQDPVSFAENSEICSERRDITNILMFMQILPVWICIFIDGRIMCVIYRLTKNMEEQSEANAFFGLSSGRSILARFTQSRSRVPPSTTVDAADSNPPKARAFFGVASSSADVTTQQQRYNNSDVEQALPSKRSDATPSTQFDDASASEACTVFSDEQTGMNGSSRRRSNLGIMMSSALESLAEEVSTHEDDDLHPTESFDTEPETLERPPEQPLDQTSTPQNKKRSRTVAIQGLWYIGGFFVTFLVSTMSLVYFMVMGEWSAPLYRASYFFMAGQGAFNFIVFAKGRRDMKTSLGGRVKKLLCFLSCKCLPNDITPPSPAVSSASTPQKQKLSGPHETQSTMSGSANSGRTPKQQTILRSDMSTEVHTNRNRVSMVSGVSSASTVVACNQNIRMGRTSSLVSIAEDAIPQDIKEQAMLNTYASDIRLSGFESTVSEAPDDFGNKAMIGESEASVCSSHEEDEVEDQILEELPRPAAQNPTGRCKDDADYVDEFEV